MRYYFFVGFSADIYKNPPRIRAFINDNFIDEYYVKNICIHDVDEDTHIEQLQPLPADQSRDPDIVCLDNIGQMNMFELEISKQHNQKICMRLEVHNDDNNYCNGFMTKWTKLRLQYLNLLPKKIFDNVDRMLLYPWLRQSDYFVDNANAVKRKFMKRPNMFTNLVSHAYFYTLDQKMHWARGFNSGSSGSFVCEVTTRFNIVNNTGKKHIGYYKADPAPLKKLYHKYVCNENSRSSSKRTSDSGSDGGG